MPRLVSAPIVALLVAFAVTGCAVGDPAAGGATSSSSSSPRPSVTPTESSTPDAEPVLTTAGLGPLVLGQPVSESGAAGKLVSWTPGCGAEDPPAPRWTVHATVSDGVWGGGHPFAIDTAARTAPLDLVEVYSAAIPTDVGVHVGSSLAELRAAYPSGFSKTVAGHYSDLYLISGPTGTLGYEVINDSSDSTQVFPGLSGTVVLIDAFASGYPEGGLTPIAGAETRGGCA